MNRVFRDAYGNIIVPAGISPEYLQNYPQVGSVPSYAPPAQQLQSQALGTGFGTGFGGAGSGSGGGNGNNGNSRVPPTPPPPPETSGSDLSDSDSDSDQQPQSGGMLASFGRAILSRVAGSGPSQRRVAYNEAKAERNKLLGKISDDNRRISEIDGMVTTKTATLTQLDSMLVKTMQTRAASADLAREIEELKREKEVLVERTKKTNEALKAATAKIDGIKSAARTKKKSTSAGAASLAAGMQGLSLGASGGTDGKSVAEQLADKIAECVELEKEIVDLRTKLAQSQQENTNLKRRIDLISEDLKDAQKAQETAENDKAIVEQNLVYYVAENSRLTKELEAARRGTTSAPSAPATPAPAPPTLATPAPAASATPSTPAGKGYYILFFADVFGKTYDDARYQTVSSTLVRLFGARDVRLVALKRDDPVPVDAAGAIIAMRVERFAAYKGAPEDGKVKLMHGSGSNGGEILNAALRVAGTYQNRNVVLLMSDDPGVLTVSGGANLSIINGKNAPLPAGNYVAQLSSLEKGAEDGATKATVERIAATM